LRALDARSGALVAGQVRVADTFASRLRGLLGSAPLGADEGLLLVGDSSIHSFFMRYDFDAVYLSADNRVLRIDVAMRPNRIGPLVRGARQVLELQAHTAVRSGLTPGDTLIFEP
jgi:uncharacterized protein